MTKKGRNPNGEGSRKTMPDGRVSYRAMVGKSADGKPIYIQVYRRKGETVAKLKKRFAGRIIFPSSIFMPLGTPLLHGA